MIQIKCIRRRKHYYSEDIETISSLGVLIIFLTGDYLSFSESFKEWVLGDDTGTGGNVTFMDKKDNNIILTLDPVVYEADVPFIASQQEFLAILNMWDRLYHEGWQEIIITQDDSGVHLVGKNNE